MPPERLVAHLETRFNSDIANFREAVDQVVGTQIDAVTWTVTGYDSVIAEATRLIDAAEERIVCSLWRHEATRLLPALPRATEEGSRCLVLLHLPARDSGPASQLRDFRG